MFTSVGMLLLGSLTWLRETQPQRPAISSRAAISAHPSIRMKVCQRPRPYQKPEAWPGAAVATVRGAIYPSAREAFQRRKTWGEPTRGIWLRSPGAGAALGLARL